MAWEVKKLNKVGNIFSGNSINAKTKKEKYLDIPEGTPYVATKDVSYDSVIDYNNGIKIPNSDLDKFRIAHKNSILICAEGGSAGRKLAFNTKDICFVNKLFALEPFDFMDPRYVFYFYYTSDFQDQFKSRMTGLIGGVSMGKFKDIDIPVPPLPIQKKIVEVLDSAFEKIAKAKENSEQNLKNAKKVFESYLQKVFENKGDNWEEITLGDIGKVSMCKRIFKAETKKEGDIPFYKIGTFGKKPDCFISKEKFNEYKSKFSFPKKGDILISASGTIGRRVKYDGEPAYFQDSNIVWIDNDEKRILNKYLYHYYEACNWNSSKGATISRLYNDNLKQMKISFPKSLESQSDAVKIMNNLSNQTKQLEQIYSQKLSCLEELKQSILQKAFKGELTEVSS